MADAAIRYGIVDCPLGLLLVAATQRGVCNVRLGDDAAELATGLRDEFPFATIVEDAAGLGAWIEPLRRYLEGRTRTIDVPLDVRASRFQKRVWEALRKIPYGRVQSYSEVAARLERPQAARAVARACATNPAALVVPCHRVVGKRGDLTGYRWGVERKRALLETEARHAERAVQRNAASGLSAAARP